MSTGQVRRFGSLLPSVAAAVALNILLLVSAAVLSRDRPLAADMTEPVAVNLVTLEAAPPPVEEERTPPPPPPEPEPRQDFIPDLAAPNPLRPELPGIQVNLDPSLFQGRLDLGDFVFNSGDLDQPPRALVRTKPVYPYRASQRNIEGEVRIKLLVRADGSVGDVIVLSSRPKGVFEEAVLAAAAGWKFQPGTIEGRAVPAWVATTVRMVLDR